MAPLCTHCGFVNPSGMRFCGNCGARLPEEAGLPVLGERTLDKLVPVQPAPPSLADFTPESIGVLVGADLLERFRKAGLEARGQRRNVTVLFADLAGYTQLSSRLDSEDVYELIQETIRSLVQEVYKYEGVVDKLTGDGLMALFGAPIAHENNAERAIRAALDMQLSLRSLRLRFKESLNVELHLRIGLNAGSVVVGSVGSEMLMNYTAIGDTVNLAHRFEEAAQPGAVLVTESVFHQTKALFDFQLVPQLSLKGIPQPLTGYQVLGIKRKPGTLRGLEGLHAPMVGRDQELNQLKQAATALTQRKQGQFVMITGEAGIGKSRLTRELKEQIGQAPLCILEGHSLTYRRSVSYWIFLDILRSCLVISADTPEAEVSQKLIQRAYQSLGSRAVELLPYLEHLLSLKPSDPSAVDRISYLDASQLRQHIFLAVRELLAAEARRRPLLLILEDLHWADEASLDLLLFLLDTVRQTPLLILAISRPFQEGTLAKIDDWALKHLADRYTKIQLQSLSPDQSGRLLLELLSIPEIPESLREQIVQRAAGVPFYLEEILRTLIDRRLLERQSGGWRLAPGMDADDLGVPDTLQGLILARFDRLDGLSRRILQVAAVIGNQFSLQLLAAMLPEADQAEIDEALEQLVERDFILRLPGLLEAEKYAFRHVLMSEAIYNTLLKRERSQLHGQVGEAIEALYGDRLEEQIELLARHYAWSTRQDRALHYLILAGQKAARSYVSIQARQNFDLALEILSKIEHTPGQALQAHMGSGDVLVMTGEYQAAREHYQAAVIALACEADRAGVVKERCILLRKISTTYERQGDYDLALHYLAEAQQVLSSALVSDPVEDSQLLNEIGWINFRRGNLDLAEEMLVKALSLAESQPQYDLTASIYNRLGGICFQKGQLDQASNYVRKSLVLREEMGDSVAVARSYNNLGLLGWKRGDWDSALTNFMHSVKLHANLGDVEGVMELHSNLGLLEIDRGNPEEARQHLQAALTTAEQIGHTFVIGITYLHLSHLCICIQEWKTALEYSQRSLEIIREIGDPENQVDAYINIGLAYLGLGELEQALQWGSDALLLLDHPSGSPNGKKPGAPLEIRGRALRLLGEAYRQRGSAEQAGRLLKESAEIFQMNANQLEQGRSSLALAKLAADRGDFTSARVLLSEARLIFRQLGAKLDLRQLQTMYAAHLYTSGSAGDNFTLW